MMKLEVFGLKAVFDAPVVAGGTTRSSRVIGEGQGCQGAESDVLIIQTLCCGPAAAVTEALPFSLSSLFSGTTFGWMFILRVVVMN